MLRALFKLILLVIVLVAVGGFFLGWWSSSEPLPDRDAIATAGRTAAERAKDAGARIGDKTAAAAKEVAQETKDALSDGALTGKIKAKMALDDFVKASDVNVDTKDGVVTIGGTVRTAAERDRALKLARETNGVKQVIDRITVSSR
jgi:hyperosmotically inducible protein